MEIQFKTSKLEKILNSYSLMQRKFGTDQAKQLKYRLGVLKNAMNLAEVPALPPERRHELSGDLKDCFAVDLKDQFRLIFKPDYVEIPRKVDGGIDLQKIERIKILSVEDYH